LIAAQYPSSTQTSSLIATFWPSGVAASSSPGQPVALVHSRQFSHVSSTMLNRVISGR
jgi:hypothetical protein